MSPENPYTPTPRAAGLPAGPGARRLDTPSFFTHPRRMSEPIRRHYLPDEVERRLIEAIRRGDYADTLPGERVLCGQFAVSRPTLRRAMSALAAQGWIARSRGKPTRILRREETKASPARTNTAVFLSSHPLGELSAGTMLTYDLLDRALSKTGYALGFGDCPAFRQKLFANRLRETLRGAPADVRVLHQAPEPVQHWFAKEKTPCIVMGTPAPGADLPGIDSDFAPAAAHALSWLRREGHSAGRILLLLPKLELAGHRAMREGFLRAGGKETRVLTHPVDDDALPAWLAKELVPRLRAGADSPTAIITGWPRFTVALVTGLAARHGLRAPDDLSVACLADDPVFDMMIPTVSRYRRPAGKYVARLARMIMEVAQGMTPREKLVLLMPEQVPGGTVGPPPVG